MLLKLKITCTLKVLTGLHIGDNSGFAPIGALDNPVVRDSYTGDPVIPGSSLKGKMRTLLSRAALPADKYVLPSFDQDPENILRLFGTAGNNRQNPEAAHLQFSDAFLVNREEMLRVGGITEIKSENAITRSTSVANPRTMERIVRGAKFGVMWFYTMDKPENLQEDMETLAEGCKLVSMDYLGGSGTRGYGRVAFEDFRFDVIHGSLPDGMTVEDLEKPFKDVSTYGEQDL